MNEFRGDAVPMVIPDNLSSVQFMLDYHHPRRPLRPANAPWFIDDTTGRPVFLEEIRSRVWGLANALAVDYGIENDDVVCLFAPNHVDFPVAMWAAHRLGAVACCVNPASTVPELVHALKASKSKLIVTIPSSLETATTAAKEASIQPQNILLLSASGPVIAGAPSVDALIEKGLQLELSFVEPILAPGEAARKVGYINFSSGTTGLPKAVAISHHAVVANVIQMVSGAGVTFLDNDRPLPPGSVAFGVLPFFHIGGLIASLHYMPFCATTVLAVQKFGLDTMLSSIKRFNVSTLFVVPPIAVLLTKHPIARAFDFSGIKMVVSIAAPMSAELHEDVVKLIPGAVVAQGYGMTELPASVANVAYGFRRPPFGSAGRLLPGIVARIVKPDGSLGATGERGELIVKSPATALGYINAPEANKETFVDGWVHTGDEASIDADNWVWIHDRIKELIKVRGFQVAPAELEGHILSHPDVRDACVVGVPDDYSGEVPMAFIVLSEPAAARLKADPAEDGKIKAAVAKHVADAKTAYKKLAGGVAFVDDIPKNSSGKLLRRVLREKAKALKAADHSNAKL